jgi:DNA-binding XRE family transcriptional regulator
MSVQLIERNGQPEWAVLPYDEYLALVEQAEMLEDIQDINHIKKALESGEEELIPAEVVNALLDYENPIKVWREFRGMTQQQLAKSIGISTPYISQLESGKREASIKVLTAIARIFNVDVDDLIVRQE